LPTSAKHGSQLLGRYARHADALYKTAPLNDLPTNPRSQCGKGEENEPRSHSVGIADGKFKLIAEDVSRKNISCDPYQCAKAVEQHESAEVCAGAARERRSD